jgi:Uma2 family endonuclease
MTAERQPRPISVQDYLSGEETSPVKHEFLGGVVHAMSGATNRHNAIAVSIIVALGSRLRGHPCQPFNSDTKVRIRLADHTRFYYPDAMVVCQSNPPDDPFQDQPVILAEVLSDSTRRTDLVEKRDAYLTIPSLQTLMFIEPDQPSALVLRRQPDGSFASEVHSGSEAVIALPEIAAELPLAEVYERVPPK